MKFKVGQLVTTKKGEFPGNDTHGRVAIVARTDNTFGGMPVIDVYWLHSKCTLSYLPGALIRINPQEADNAV